MDMSPKNPQLISDLKFLSVHPLLFLKLHQGLLKNILNFLHAQLLIQVFKLCIIGLKNKLSKSLIKRKK